MAAAEPAQPLRLEWVEAGSLDANPLNWRRHPEGQMDALRESLADDGIGWAGALLYNERTGHLIDGHARKEAVDPETIVPVLIGNWTEEAERKILLTLDPITAMAEADGAVLRKLLEETAFQTDGLSGVLDGLWAELRASEDAQPIPPEADDVPAPPKKATTKPGDLWLLGDHRLLCGDATKAKDVKRLMGKERAGLMNTDPPYGISFDNATLGPTRKDYKAIANDSLHDEALQQFLELAFRSAKDMSLKGDAAWYLWHAHLTQGFFAAAAAAAVILHRQIIWVKPVLVMGRGQYHWKHEPCFMGWVKGHPPPDYGLGNGERTQTTIWKIGGVTQAERREFDHATPKPAELFAIPIVKHLKPSEIAYEPFAGTGPQFIAAEQLNRRCFGIEIEPAYCDVIVRRWQKFTGRLATLDRTGKSPIPLDAE